MHKYVLVACNFKVKEINSNNIYLPSTTNNRKDSPVNGQKTVFFFLRSPSKHFRLCEVRYTVSVVIPQLCKKAAANNI